jgi:NAD(P)-dependent dehydrogenase (short-subunit alcohol dehydrogenase family)
MARKAIITGASSGIGKSTAIALAQAGYDVGVTWHADEPGIEGTVGEVEDTGRNIAVRQVDLEDPTGGAQVVHQLGDELGGLDVFVSNAGAGKGAPFLEHEWTDWMDTMNIVLNSAFLGMQAAAREMVDRDEGGRIIAVTSVHEHVPKIGMASYCAAKGGLGLLVKTAALELAEHGITVNAVAPGEIATKMTGQQDEEPSNKERTGVPLGRPGHADEIAAAIRFLASEGSSYITGESLVVDGGMLLMAAHAE